MLTAIVTRSGEAAVSVRLVETDPATPTEAVVSAETEETVLPTEAEPMMMSSEPVSDAVPTEASEEVPVAAEVPVEPAPVEVAAPEAPSPLWPAPP